MTNEQTAITNDGLLTLKEVAMILRMEVVSLYQSRLRHDLPWLLVNGRLLLRASDLAGYLDGCREQHAA